MGTATIIVKRPMLANLLINYSDQIRIDKASAQDDLAEEFLCEVTSKKLPAGYNHMCFVILKQWDLFFRPDEDC